METLTIAVNPSGTQIGFRQNRSQDDYCNYTEASDDGLMGSDMSFGR
jgi:hypothetical protein